jgi:membrane-associated PAP2 superfamily phosphatase
MRPLAPAPTGSFSLIQVEERRSPKTRSELCLDLHVRRTSPSCHASYTCLSRRLANLVVVLTWIERRRKAMAQRAIRADRTRGDFPRAMAMCASIVGAAAGGTFMLAPDLNRWGRARPLQVIEFGGTKTFTPPLIRANQCRRNCSFVSREASSMFAAFYATALVVPQWSLILLLAGTVAGFGTGLIRMAQGAHFLSVFAGVFMALTVTGLHRLVFDYAGRSTPQTPEKALASRGP